MHCWGGLLERGNPRNDRRGGLGRIPDHDLLRGRFADDPGANVPAGQLQAVRQQLQAGRKRQRRHSDSGIPRRIHHAQRIYGPLHAQRRLYGDDQLRRSAAGGQHGFLLPGSARLYDTRPQDDSKDHYRLAHELGNQPRMRRVVQEILFRSAISPSRPKRATISVSPTPLRPTLRSSSSREANFCSKVRR